MKAVSRLGIAFLLCCGSMVAAFGQPSPVPAQATSAATISSELDKVLSLVEQEVVGAADAMPEDKYSFAPTSGEYKGVRNFGNEVKHIADANYFYYCSILDTQPPARSAVAEFTTKTQIMQYLRDSFALGHRAVASITADNALLPLPNRLPFKTRLSMAAWAPVHSFDIYGQMVEYLRMNGIIPPASRQKTE
jgi:hypothetical protein